MNKILKYPFFDTMFSPQFCKTKLTEAQAGCRFILSYFLVSKLIKFFFEFYDSPLFQKRSPE